MPRFVVLTDEDGLPRGQMEIQQAHSGTGALHRAFSVYVFRHRRTELLIQQRSQEKWLWPLFWANTCCSHPHAHETAVQAGERRLAEELGFSCPLREHGSFVYRAEDPFHRGVEHEHVTILLGDAEAPRVQPDPLEVAACKWVGLADLHRATQRHPDEYAPWFLVGLPLALATGPVA